MTFLFDNHCSPKHVRMLQALGVDARALRDVFAQDVKDYQFLPQLKDTGWILVTCDKHILTRRVEARALRQSGGATLFFKAFWPKMGLWQQAARLTKHWQEIEAFVARADPSTYAEVQHNGKIALLKI